MPLRYVPPVTRRAIYQDRSTLYAYEDNLLRRGWEGSAGECRGEPNAVPIATMHYPGAAADLYLSDDDFGTWRADVTPKLQQLAEHLRAGGIVAWPAGGIGTGQAELARRSPRIWRSLENARERLAAIGGLAAPAPLPPAEHPLVRRVLAAFPGAQIISVRGPDQGEPTSADDSR